MSDILSLEEVSKNQINPLLVGGKAYALAKLKSRDFLVPNGFVITTKFFDRFSEEIKHIDEKDKESIIELCDKFFGKRSVAVRSSATVEDSERQSFAGQFDSFLNIEKEGVIDAIQKCWQSLTGKRAVTYSKSDIVPGKMSVLVQEMVCPDVSGVAFSSDPVTGSPDSIIIESVQGSCEGLVQGAANPDHYVVSKKNSSVGKKILTRNEVGRQTLHDQNIIRVSKLVEKIEKIFCFPVDVEWAMENNHIFILQSRPITGIK